VSEPATPVGPPEPQARPAVAGARRPRTASFVVFVLAFLFLAGAAAGALWGQFQPGKTGPWASLACSAGAVALTVVAVLLRPKR
jgi:hypothetical protein